MFRSLWRNSPSASEYIFPAVDPARDGPDCKRDCADCTVQFPSKVKIETSRPLYGHIKEFSTHVLVATGQSDWTPKVEQEKGSLMEAFDGTSYKSKQGVSLSCRSSFMSQLFCTYADLRCYHN